MKTLALCLLLTSSTLAQTTTPPPPNPPADQTEKVINPWTGKVELKKKPKPLDPHRLVNCRLDGKVRHADEDESKCVDPPQQSTPWK